MPTLFSTRYPYTILTTQRRTHMKIINVYEQYFSASCLYNGIQRNGALVTLTSTSEQGTIKYEITLTFFPHTEPEDFSISYDAYTSLELYYAKGRRSKKRETAFLEQLQSIATELAGKLGGTIDWNKPLCPARYA